MPEQQKMSEWGGGWWLRLTITAAAVSQGIYMFGSGDRFFARLTYTLVCIIAFAAWWEYLSLPKRLKKRGSVSAQTLNGELLSKDNNQSSRS